MIRLTAIDAFAAILDGRAQRAILSGGHYRRTLTD